jgi:hypothetical protein
MSIFGTIIKTGNFATPAGEKLYQTALSLMGHNLCPQNNEFGCAESVNEVVFDAFGDYAGGDLSTARLYLSIQNNSKFVQITSPVQGDIIVSPTGYGNGSLPNGHVGIVGANGVIMSNTSATGLWSQNYTLSSWKKRYADLGGFPVFYFRRLFM